MVLDDLLHELPVTDFLEEHYLKRPYASVGGCAAYTRLGNWELIERILDGASADVIIARQHDRWPGTKPPTASEARELFSSGFTIGIRGAAKHDLDLADFAERFHTSFGGAVDVHVYATPAGQPGFGWHYDVEEVFVLQTVGAKRWLLRKNTVNPWPVRDAMPRDLRYEREITPLLQCDLLAGDWLYIPSGYWHKTQAISDSISLSIGVQALTALDVLDRLRATLSSSILWRQRIAPQLNGCSNAIDQCQQLFHLLGDDLCSVLRDREFIRDFLSTRAEELADKPVDR